jgi:hypothetical protein
MKLKANEAFLPNPFLVDFSDSLVVSLPLSRSLYLSFSLSLFLSFSLSVSIFFSLFLSFWPSSGVLGP